MSKATQRAWKRRHREIIAKRLRDEAEAKARRLGGFKPATPGEMLATINGRSS